MEKKLVSSQSVERAGAPANSGNDDQPLAFGLHDVSSTTGACFPGLGNAFRENPPKLPSGWVSIQEALAFVTFC